MVQGIESIYIDIASCFSSSAEITLSANALFVSSVE